MVDVFEDTLNIGAGCPSDIAVNTNTRFQGTVDYHLVNRGDEDGFISILVTLIDSAGNNMQFSSSLQQVPAGGDFTDSHLLFLDASYDTPRQINVTMRIEFSGALSDVKFAECSFNVTGGQPSPLAWIIHDCTWFFGCHPERRAQRGVEGPLWLPAIPDLLLGHAATL